MLVKSNVVVFRHVIVREVTGGGRDRKEIPSFPSHNRPRQRAGDDDPVVAGEHPGEGLAVTLRQRLPQPPLLLPASPASILACLVPASPDRIRRRALARVEERRIILADVVVSGAVPELPRKLIVVPDRGV
jgi:hypothetical protein